MSSSAALKSVFNQSVFSKSGIANAHDRLSLVTCDERPDLLAKSIQLEDDVWETLSFLDATYAHDCFYNALLARHPEYRICLLDNETGEMIATGMCVPLKVDAMESLPHEGWDWIVQTCFEQQGVAPNMVGALSISVPEKYRHAGYARDMINTMRALAAYKGLGGVIAPVRPSKKCIYPDVAMDDYVRWTDINGKIFDPWLRSHVAVGGKIVRVCDRSMVVERDLEFWRPWASVARDGAVAFSGGLAPLRVDASSGMARYVEPNVWVTHLL